MKIIIFDSVCLLCQSSIKFIKKADKKKMFTLISREDSLAKEMISKYGCFEDSIIFIQEDKAFTYSEAVLEIAKDLGGMYKCFYIFKIIPKKLRDSIYTLIARYRYKLFGKNDDCKL